MDGYDLWTPNFDDNSPWRWNWEKFDMKPEDLFRTLHKQYNTVPYKIKATKHFITMLTRLPLKLRTRPTSIGGCLFVETSGLGR
jgi:hypothetical protein